MLAKICGSCSNRFRVDHRAVFKIGSRADGIGETEGKAAMGKRRASWEASEFQYGMERTGISDMAGG